MTDTTSESPEFSRMIDRRALTDAPVALSANEEERAALARRFGLVRIDSLEASITLTPKGDEIAATGTLDADIIQSCAVSGDDLPAVIHEDISIRFLPGRVIEADEVELEEDELDEIFYTGTAFDLGEAVAQSLALAIDPYATGPNADAAREEAGITDSAAPSGPLAEALRALTTKK